MSMLDCPLWDMNQYPGGSMVFTREQAEMEASCLEAYIQGHTVQLGINAILVSHGIEVPERLQKISTLILELEKLVDRVAALPFDLREKLIPCLKYLQQECSWIREAGAASA